MNYLKDREIWLSNVPTGNPPAGFFWKFIQNGKVVVRDSNGNNQIMVSTSGSQAITGSLTVTGGITGTVSSASYVEYSNVANKPTLVSGSAQITGFGIFATTGSNQFNGSQAITGSLTVTGAIVAQTLNVQQVTSSVVFSSGSNVFGNSLGNTQQFTGSVGVTGSFTITTNGVELQVTNTGVNLGNALTDSHIISGSLRVNPNGLFVSGSGIVGMGTILPSERFEVNTGQGARAGMALTGEYPYLRFNVSSSSANARNWAFNATNAEPGDFAILQSTSKDGNPVTAGTSILGFGRNGAATFLGPTVTIGNAVAATNVKLILSGVASKAAGIEFHQSGTPQWYIGNGIASEDNNFELYNSNGTMAMKIIKSTNAINFIGAATFTGTTGNRLTLYNSGNNSGINGLLIDSDIYPGITFNNRVGNAGGGKIVYNTYATGYGSASLNGSILLQADNAMQFSSGGDNVRMTILANGNVGIGTATPDQKLVVSGTDTILSVVDTRSFAAGVGGSLYLLGNYRSVGDVTVAGYIKGSKVNSTDGDYGFDLIFGTQQYTGGVAERFRITSTGVLKSLPTYNNTTGVAANVQIDSNGFFARSTSSLKYKKDIRNYDKGLNLINLLRPVYYKGKSESDGDKQFVGLIAEEVHNLGLIEFVQYAPDGSPDALSYQNMIALAIKAIQEQQTLIESLKSRIEILEQ